MSTATESRVPLVDAALRLRQNYWTTRDMVLRGDLEGGADDRRRWYVTTASLEAALQRATRSAQ